MSQFPTLTMSQLKSHRVPAGSIAMWWLGQLSYIFKSPGGVIIALDPYLSDSCNGIMPALDMKRKVPPLIQPGDLVGIDTCLLTHSHQDHLDPQTLAPYRAAGGRGPYVAPPETCEKLESLGVPKAELRMTWPNKVHTVGDVDIRCTFAIPFGGDDLTHVGYILEVKKGPKVYITGDTNYEEILGLSVAPHKPDVMITVINGGWRNLDTNAAAKLTKEINPKVAIPCHYDLFNANQTSPLTFRTNLSWMGMIEKYRELKHGVAWTWPEG